MERNLYAPPEAAVADVEPVFEVPDDVLKKIRQAWMAGACSTVITLAVTLLAIAGTSIAGFDAWNMVDVLLVGGLTWGIYRKSRFAAVAMLAYFVISKALMFAEGGKPAGVVWALIFFYLYVQGIRGTFQYHKLAKKQ
ncbi:MAG TPA: hypothetical protein VF522_09645 [Ramlibacter sp.]|uniref:hypothetical protein n=1 Tax=Ramlibacter sp. TaxID=1917967 RepID=UPI002ED03549